MASHTIVKVTDDLDGSDATETVQFAYAGSSYEIDLNSKNAKKFNEALAPFIAAARKTGSNTRKAASSRTTKASGSDVQAMRSWLRDKGHKVNDRGRISQDLKDLYHSAVK